MVLNGNFFAGFLESFEEDAGGFALMEPEGSVVGTTDQVVRVDVLYDAQRSSHGDG